MFKMVASDWKGPQITLPHLCVLYDTLESSYGRRKDAIEGLSDPHDATIIARNLIHEIWEAYTSWYTVVLEDELIDDEWAFENLNVDAAIKLAKDRNSFENYQTTFSHCSAIRRGRRDLQALRHSFTAPNEDEYGAFDDGGTQSFANSEGEGCDSRSTAFEERRWATMDNRWQELELTTQAFMESFATRADMLHAITSSRQSRSSGQLTMLATVAVPFSVIAAIFSMGGDYAAGEAHFAVYWGISVPLAAFLLAWVIFSDNTFRLWHKVQDPICNRICKVRPRRKKVVFAEDQHPA